MEFYFKLSKPGMICNLFQFPTGWNSTLRLRSARAWIRVSIPNGMEFYEGKKLYVIDVQARFQFPTGWNSTWSHRQHLRKPRNSFQFPTGWNSTEDERHRGRPAIICFNSQRDGILLRDSATAKPALSSFNSQRDGILQTPARSFLSAQGVSIPNGMEFYSFSL